MGEGFKRFIKNKNTVTVLCVALIVVVLWIGYSWRIKSQTNPISVPYAKVNIQPKTKITEEMIGYMSVPASMIKDTTITSVDDIKGKYSNYNTMIPEGSLFYKKTVVDYDQMPDSAFSDLPDGYTVVSLPVNNDSTLGNSIFPGNYIDLYYKSSENGKLLFGKFIESIEVLDVRDASGQHVFENTDEPRVPAYLLFAVPEELHLLLRKALYIGSADIVPVQRNSEYSKNPEKTNVSSAYIKQTIIDKTIKIPDEKLPKIESN